MARATTATKLPLDRWARLFGLNPVHFNGVAMTEMQRSSCDNAWYQYEWQASDRVSREEVANAIAQAEAMIERYLGFHLIPTWTVDERVATARPLRSELIALTGLNIRDYRQTVEARWGHFVTGGIRGEELIEANATITYASTKAPTSYEDQATVTVTVDSGTDACELRVYYPGKAADERWRIRPISVTVSGTTATITFPRELAVIEAIQESMELNADSNQRLAIADDDTDFLEEVDVYRVYNDPSTMASVLWEPTGGACSCSGSATCTECAFTAQTACLLPRDLRRSIVAYRPANWDATNEDWDPVAFTVGRQPDHVRLYYRSGYESPDVDCPVDEMDPSLEAAVARLAASLLERPPCQCAEETWRRWMADLAFEQGAEQFSRYRLSRADLDNPFGTRAGAVWAWRRVNDRELAIGQAVDLTL